MATKTKKNNARPKKATEPPKKLSTLLRWALDDLDRFARRPGCKVDMFHWAIYHNTDNNGQMGECAVCLAGACLIERGPLRGVPVDKLEETVDDVMSDDSWYRAASSLNDLRQGRVIDAVDTWFQEEPPLRPGETALKDVFVDDYRNSPSRWRQDMDKVMKMLLKYGL